MTDTVAEAFELLGAKWVVPIVTILMTSPPLTYSGLRDALDVPEPTLSLRLPQLEDQGLIQRIVKVGRPVVITYKLTAKGQALQPIFAAVAAWAKPNARQRSHHSSKVSDSR